MLVPAASAAVAKDATDCVRRRLRHALPPFGQPFRSDQVFARQFEIASQGLHPRLAQHAKRLILQPSRDDRRVFDLERIDHAGKGLPCAVHQSGGDANLAVRLQCPTESRVEDGIGLHRLKPRHDDVANLTVPYFRADGLRDRHKRPYGQLELGPIRRTGVGSAMHDQQRSGRLTVKKAHKAKEPPEFRIDRRKKAVDRKRESDQRDQACKRSPSLAMAQGTPSCERFAKLRAAERGQPRRSNGPPRRLDHTRPKQLHPGSNSRGAASPEQAARQRSVDRCRTMLSSRRRAANTAAVIKQL